MSFEAQLTVEIHGSRILPHHFQVKRGDFELAGGVLQESHGLASPASGAIIGEQKEFVNEGIAAQPFQAVAEAENDVADGFSQSVL